MNNNENKKITFNVDGNDYLIQSKENETMDEIIKRFSYILGNN